MGVGVLAERIQARFRKGEPPVQRAQLRLWHTAPSEGASTDDEGEPIQVQVDSRP